MSGPAESLPDTVLVDCHHAGISGDMLLGALLDLGASRETVAREISLCTSGVGSVEMNVRRVKRASMACTKVDFEISESGDPTEMGKCLERASDEWVVEKAQEVLSILRRAESKVHGTEGKEHHHLHELGRIDAVADIVGCLTAWRSLGLDGLRALSTRVALGGGNVVFSHGDFPVPAPATLEILKGYPVNLGGKRELTTPTGASLLVTLVDEFVDSVDLTPTITGLGAGSDAGEFLNATRIVLGRTGVGDVDFVDLVETNIDDETPEALAHAAERLMEEGALDVSIVPCIMKKGRPGNLVRVVAPPDNSDRLCEYLLRESGSLGARISRRVERRLVRREARTVKVRVGGVEHRARLKGGIGADGVLENPKPEYEDVREIARRSGVPFQVAYRAILEAWSRAQGAD